jgi:hypothetical protein
MKKKILLLTTVLILAFSTAVFADDGETGQSTGGDTHGTGGETGQTTRTGETGQVGFAGETTTQTTLFEQFLEMFT